MTMAWSTHFYNGGAPVDDRESNRNNSWKLLLTGVVLGLLAWIVEVNLHAVVDQSSGFLKELHTPFSVNFLVHSWLLAAFILFGAYCARLLARTRRSEERFLAAEEQYRDLFENANDLVLSVDMDGRFLYVNRAWLRTLGYAKEEVPGLTLAMVIHPDYERQCTAAFEKARSGEDIGRIEAGFVARDGHTVIVEGSVSCRLQQGKPVALRCIFSNITGRRSVEEFNKDILESVDEGFTVVTPDYRIALANKAFCAAVKLTAREVVGKHCFEVSHHTNRPCFEEGEACAVREVFRTGEVHTATHMHFDSRGNPIYMEIKAYPMRDSLGKVVSAIEVHNDISERKRLEEQLRHSQKMEAIGTLAGGVAHDFNNILTAIIGYGSLLQMRIDPASPLRSNVDQILASTERAANLTQRLLAFSRKQNTVLKPVDLNAIVGRVNKLLGMLIGEDIEIRLQLHPTGLGMQADAGQIEQVLMNLVTNARDAMPRGGRAVGRHREHRDRREFHQDPRVREGGALCPALGLGHGAGHGPGNTDPDFRSLLYDQGGRQGDRPRPGHRLRHHQAAQRFHQRVQRSE